jgi:hypothetical protein
MSEPATRTDPATRTQLTADEQIRATALTLACEWSSLLDRRELTGLADDLAAYIRGETR